MKVPHFSCRCRLSEVSARAHQVAETRAKARAVRRTDVACTLGLALLLALASYYR